MSMHKKYGFANLKKGLPLPPLAGPGLKPTIRRSHYEGFYCTEPIWFVDPTDGEALTLDFKTATFSFSKETL